MASKRKPYVGRVYLGHENCRLWHWVGRFERKRDRDNAVARAKVEKPWGDAPNEMTCGRWVDRFLARYERERKDSSYDTARSALARFRADFGDRPVASVTRHEAIDWAERVPASRVPIVVTLFNVAVDEELIDRNPFRGLGTARAAVATSARPPWRSSSGF
jgi:hypothetical protein